MKKYQLQTAALVLMAFVLGCSEFIIVGILSDIATALHTSQTSVGNLVTVFALVYAVCTPFVATFLGRGSTTRALLLLTVVFIAGNLLSFIAGNYTVLLISRVVTALVSGAMLSLGFAIANQAVPLEARAGAISWIFSGFSIAAVFGVPLGAWISARAGWHMAFLAIIIASVAVLALLAVLLPREPAGEQKPVTQQFRLFADRRIQAGVLVPLFGAAGIYVFYTYLRPILAEPLHYSVSAITILLTVYGGMTIFSNHFSGMLARGGLGMQRMPKAFAAEAVLLFLLPLALQSRVLGTVAVMALGLMMYLFNSPAQLFFLGVAERDHPEAIVLASSLSSIFFNFGISLGSLVGGVIVDTAGLLFVGIGGGALTVAAVAVNLWVNRLTPEEDAGA